MSKCFCSIQKARSSAAASWYIKSTANKNHSSHSHDDESTGFDYYDRRLAIEQVFKTLYKQRVPDMWHEEHVESGIMDRLDFPSGSRNSVKKYYLTFSRPKSIM